ncbi:MAG TPA: hypothetical protein VK864_01550, partial [Longimicrobiales bacterium]|nr:hypothetical protein [Longimicrobiales bacterium]
NPLQTMTITLKSIDAVEPCEEAFTDFDGGEFGWRIAVIWPDGSQNVLGSTSAFPGAGGYRQIKKNASMTTSVSATKQLRGAAGMMVTVEARASEFDFDLFGNNPFADNRMNDVRVNVNHAYSATGWATGDRALDVRPVSACHLRVRYSVAVS